MNLTIRPLDHLRREAGVVMERATEGTTYAPKLTAEKLS